MAAFAPVDIPGTRTCLWEVAAELTCPCGLDMELGNAYGPGPEDDVPCPCGRVYRLRLVIEVAVGV